MLDVVYIFLLENHRKSFIVVHQVILFVLYRRHTSQILSIYSISYIYIYTYINPYDITGIHDNFIEGPMLIVNEDTMEDALTSSLKASYPLLLLVLCSAGIAAIMIWLLVSLGKSSRLTLDGKIGIY